MPVAARGYRPRMSDQQPPQTSGSQHPARQASEAASAEARDNPLHPTINQPVNAEPRARLAPALLVAVIVAGIVVLILALTML